MVVVSGCDDDSECGGPRSRAGSGNRESGDIAGNEDLAMESLLLLGTESSKMG